MPRTQALRNRSQHCLRCSLHTTHLRLQVCAPLLAGPVALEDGIDAAAFAAARPHNVGHLVRKVVQKRLAAAK